MNEWLSMRHQTNQVMELYDNLLRSFFHGERWLVWSIVQMRAHYERIDSRLTDTAAKLLFNTLQ